MIICHEHKFIFLKTRKTASTSIEIALSKLCGDADTLTPLTDLDAHLRKLATSRSAQNFMLPGGRLRRHSTASNAMFLIPSDVWNGYFKFTFERNPYDKAVSLYYWRTHDVSDPPGIDDFILDVSEESLSNWYIYADGSGIVADKVYSYEHFDEELKQLETDLGMSGASNAANGLFDEMPRAKTSFRRDRRPYQELIGAKARTRIEAVCQREIAHFGYSW